MNILPGGVHTHTYAAHISCSAEDKLPEPSCQSTQTHAGTCTKNGATQAHTDHVIRSSLSLAIR